MNREAEIEARLAIVAARAHRQLSDDESILVRERIERDLQQREDMRSLPLGNGDAPDSMFNPRAVENGGRVW